MKFDLRCAAFKLRLRTTSALILAGVSLLAAQTHAAVSLQLEFFQDNNPGGSPFFYVYSYLDASPAPITHHSVSSANGTIRSSLSASNSFDFAGGSFPTLAAAVNAVTNGQWTLVLNTNHASQQTYQFNVTVTNLNTNTYPPVMIFSPAHNAVGVSNHPNYFWSGPTNYTELYLRQRIPDYSYDTAYLVATNLTNWTDALSLPSGPMLFEVNYSTTNTATIAQISTPTNGSGALAGWSSLVKLRTYRVHEFTVASATDAGHTLVAHYPFNGSAIDISGNGYDINASAGWGPNTHAFTNAAAAGSGALRFFGDTALAPPSNVVVALHGSFTVSAWVKTTQLVGSPDDEGYSGVGVVWANMGGDAHSAIPISLTGGRAAFYTSNAGGPEDTLHSTNNVNTGSYVHIAVTRSQQTGQKKIYINGALNNTSTGITAPLDAPQEQFDLLVGGRIGLGLDGLLDDLQFYTGVLSAGEIATLYANPGTNIANSSSSQGILAHYTFDDSGDLGVDDSGNGNYMDYAAGQNGGGLSDDTDSAAGAGSVYFFRDTAPDSGGIMGWYATPPALLAALAENFSISLWIRTTDDTGFEDDPASTGAGVIAADVDGTANDSIPVALTGGQVAFNTGGDSDETLNSFTLVNDDFWHHVVVTRDQLTGAKKIYIDGSQDNSGTGTTNLLNDPLLITIGALSDAAASSATNTSYYNFFEGLIDDLQIYPRVLTAQQVMHLYDNPGEIITNFNPVLDPVLVDFNLSVTRVNDPDLGDYHAVYPSFVSISPAATTTNRVESPNGWFTTEVHSGGGSSGSVITSFAGAMNELTNGLWKLYVNKGDATEQLFTFSVTATNLTTNHFPPVTILMPTNGATGVPTNSPLRWTGPTNFSTLFVHKHHSTDGAGSAGASLAVTATNWPSPPALLVGTNYFNADYTTNNVTGLITFTTPVNGSLQAVSNWTTHVELHTAAAAKFVVTSNAAALPVTLVSPGYSGGNVSFQFLSQSGLTHTVQAKTNLTDPLWISLTNIAGDGTMKLFSIQTTNPPRRFFRVGTQ